MLNRLGGSMEELWVAKNEVEDDRVLCKNCADRTTERQQINTPAEQFERMRRENHPAFRWMFDVVKIRNGWARVEYDWEVCSVDKKPCLMNVPQRCPWFKPQGTTQSVETGEIKPWWE